MEAREEDLHYLFHLFSHFPLYMSVTNEHVIECTTD